jgi:serine/threonine protein kinase
MNKTAQEVPLNLPPFRGRIHPGYNQPLVLQALSDCPRLLEQPGAKIVLEGRNKVGIVSLQLESGAQKNIFVKEYRLIGINRFKSRFLPSKAQRAWWGAIALAERGIATPSPVAYLEQRRKGFIDQSFFLTEEVEDVEEVRGIFRDVSESELRAFLIALAVFLKNCHREGILHRDLSDGNILTKKDASGRAVFYLIDTNRIRLKKKIGPLRGIKNLIRLGIPQDHQSFFLDEYLRGRNFRRFGFFWYKINKGSFTRYIGVKKTLRLRKLARKLKIQ